VTVVVVIVIVVFTTFYCNSLLGTMLPVRNPHHPVTQSLLLGKLLWAPRTFRVPSTTPYTCTITHPRLSICEPRGGCVDQDDENPVVHSIIKEENKHLLRQYLLK